MNNEYINVYFNQYLHNMIIDYIKHTEKFRSYLPSNYKNELKDTNINTTKIFRIFFFILYKVTKTGLKNTEVIINKIEYFSFFKSFDKKDIYTSLRFLTALIIKNEDNKTVHVFKNNIIYDYGFLKICFTEEFFKVIKAKRLLPIRKEVFSINIKKHTNSFMLLVRLFYDMKLNYKNEKKKGKISVKSLLEYCYYNITSIKIQEAKAHKQAIQEPFEKDLNFLEAFGIHWEYVNKPHNFNEFLETIITYRIDDFEKAFEK